MRVAKMAHIYTETRKDKATGRKTQREVYYRRFPKDVQSITGAKFIHKWPQGVSRAQANEDTSATDEFNRRIKEARAKLAPALAYEVFPRAFPRPDWTDFQAAAAQVRPVETKPVVEFESIIAAWATEKGIGSTGQRQQTSIMRDFFDFLDAGHTDMARVSDADLSRYRAHLVASVEAERFIMNTADKRLQAVKAMFRFAHENLHRLDANPAEKIRNLGGKPGTRLDFTREERSLILTEARRSEEPIIRWGNWLAAFTGCRMAEIAEAQTTDFRIIDGTMCFVLREDTREDGQTLKTGEDSERTIPLHPALIREGFMDYVNSLPAGPLFPLVKLDKDGRRNKYASNIVGEWFRPLVNNDKRKSFHSWRHDTKTRMINAGVPEPRADAITGHADKKVGRRYIHHGVPELVAAIGTLEDPA